MYFIFALNSKKNEMGDEINIEIKFSKIKIEWFMNFSFGKNNNNETTNIILRLILFVKTFFAYFVYTLMLFFLSRSCLNNFRI